MFINRISITNFKSIYGTQEFDFRKLTGVNKLTGPVGSGKTTLCEAILYGLYGQVRGQKIPSLVSWNAKDMYVEMELVSNNHLLYIKRGNNIQTDFRVDNKPIPSPSKRDIQEIINGYYDVSRLFVEKMCIISFDAAKMSLANMTPSEAKQFIDDIFGFSLFTEYADTANRNKLDIYKEISAVETAMQTVTENISRVKMKLTQQVKNAKCGIDTVEINEQIAKYSDEIACNISVIKETKEKLQKLQGDRDNITRQYNSEISSLTLSRKEAEMLGKAMRSKYNAVKTGKCITCGHSISAGEIGDIESQLHDCTEQWKFINNNIKTKEREFNEALKGIATKQKELSETVAVYENRNSGLQQQVNTLTAKLHEYEIKLNSIKSNYNDILNISEAEKTQLEDRLTGLQTEYDNWSELNELLSKTLRYNLLEAMIPSINEAIQSYISNVGIPFFVSYDQGFNAHIYSSYYKKEIPYSSLSTGQKKSVDMSIIFGIMSNIISSAKFNVIILDELFSNMDTEIRNTMVEILRNADSGKQSVFVINHSEMDDSYFNHKVQVQQRRSAVKTKDGEVPISKSVYNIIF